MTKDDALRIALSALLDCTYDERMRAIGAVKAVINLCRDFVGILAQHQSARAQTLRRRCA